MEWVLANKDFASAAMLDLDTYTQHPLDDLWRECGEAVLMYQVPHAASQGMTAAIGKAYDAVEPQGAPHVLTHFGGELVAGSKARLADFMALCRQYFNQLQAIGLTPREGDEAIWCGAAYRSLLAGQPVRAKTAGQIAYVNAVDAHTITFAIGPAGTGKTYLAVAKAVRAFQDRRIRRIILTRPAVEAGESLGFLPGTLNDKVDPYLRPLYDALSDMLGPDQLHRYLDDGTIEVAPLAYMRGRTLNDAYVILDEAQNTTEQQMKMFLTRLGFNTTMIITGDVTQVDLAVPRSGLATIEGILGGIDDIAFAHLDAGDVVRHELVGRIVEAYDRHDATRVRRNRGKESREDAR